MLKLAVAIKLRVRVKGKCSQHPGYNPNQGEAAIRGGCKQCLALFEVTRAADRLHEAVAHFEQVAAPYQLVRAAKRPSTTAQEAR